MKLLVVVDMQKDFVDGALGTAEAQAIVDNVVEKVVAAKEAGDRIIFTMDTHEANYLETAEGKNLPVEHCIEGTSGWSICKPISSLVDHGKFLLYHGAKDIVKGRFYKPTFGSIRLAEELQHICALPETDIEEIIFMGVCTDICVVSNVLLAKAYCPEVKITVEIGRAHV